MITVVNGNLFDTNAQIIAHQVNCQGVMGSGVALQVKDLYPDVFQQYKKLCESYVYPSAILLGTVQAIDIGGTRTRIIANLFAQDFYGKQGIFTDLSALELCFYKLNEYSLAHNYTIAMPWKISSDRGGADWNVVYAMIENTFKNVNIELRRLDYGV